MRKIHLLSGLLILAFQNFSTANVPLKDSTNYALCHKPTPQFNTCNFSNLNATDWMLMGRTNVNAAPYDFYYYKLVQVNSNTHRYASIIEVSVQGDANYATEQGTFEINVNKWDNTVGRFDGLEVTCISGNPSAAIFYIYNNALWFRSIYKWGFIYYKVVAGFDSDPLVGSPFGQTTVAPSGYVATTSSYGLKCNFDNSHYYQLPYHDTYGSMFVAGNVGIGTTNPVSKLSVNGTVTAKQVKVTQTGWPDFIFDSTYALISLKSLEKYLSIHKHLPGIPSSIEMTENGNNLGQTDANLLRKIEELTLYLINQNNEFYSLKREVHVLANENKMLKQSLNHILHKKTE